MSADAQYVRTTVSLREDYYQRLKRTGRPLSEVINEILAERYKRDHSLFGTADFGSRDDIRDHKDRF